MNRRWYDRIAGMTSAIVLSRHLPRELQEMIATHINEAIDEQRDDIHVDGKLKSLGSERALGLHQAAWKQRWYDRGGLHRAFTMMIGMSDEALRDYADRLIHLSVEMAEGSQHPTELNEDGNRIRKMQ